MSEFNRMQWEKRWVPHMCVVCGKDTFKMDGFKSSSSGDTAEVGCSSCNAKGVISNAPPWRGYELPLDKLRGIFALANIKIMCEPMKLQNGYWSDGNAYPWWFVKVESGWIEIGWRKRVMSINWEHTPARVVVTEDEVTKGDDHVHAYSEAKAIEYLTALSKHLSPKWSETWPVAKST